MRVDTVMRALSLIATLGLISALGWRLSTAPAHAEQSVNALDVTSAALTAESASAIEIVQAAHRAAGGKLWQQPKSLHMQGSATLFQDGAFNRKAQASSYEMWRVFPAWNSAAHSASGKVRIDAKAGAKTLFQIAFDGSHTYSQMGLQPDVKASEEWSESFGFGIIRFALGKGFKQQRLADDLVDGRLCFTVLITDPQSTDTTFWIAQDDFAIRKVGFDTPKGWHERVYSDFFRLDNGWLQPGRVRLTYRGRLSSDIRWQKAEVNVRIPERVFVLPTPGQPSLEKRQ
jgi:hypothetical protein